MKKCELCDSLAIIYCESDRASLCCDCDSKVHGANFLVAKHSRTLLCHICQSSTPWNGSGPKLGPTVSVCQSCSVNSSSQHRNGGEADDDDEDADTGEEDDDNDSENDDGGGDGIGDGEGEGNGGGEEDEDEENQVVPWSSTPPPQHPPPLVSNSSTSEECSSSFSSRDRSRLLVFTSTQPANKAIGGLKRRSISIKSGQK